MIRINLSCRMFPIRNVESNQHCHCPWANQVWATAPNKKIVSWLLRGYLTLRDHFKCASILCADSWIVLTSHLVHANTVTEMQSTPNINDKRECVGVTAPFSWFPTSIVENILRNWLQETVASTERIFPLLGSKFMSCTINDFYDLVPTL